MEERLINALPNHVPYLLKKNDSDLYIIDWKGCGFIDGKIGLLSREPDIFKTVYILNKEQLNIVFDGFPENALPISKKKRSRQCECVLFPENCDKDQWVLFIETKYAQNIDAAQDPRYKYPYCMVDQIKQTVSFFRNKGIITNSKRVNAIISFPNLTEGYSSWVFPVKHDGIEESVLDILMNDNIIIRATNKAVAYNDKLLILR